MHNQPEVREQMFNLIEQWQQSGVTQKAFCQEQSIRYYVFHYWYKRYREQHAGPQSNAASFVKLQIVKPATSGLNKKLILSIRHFPFYAAFLLNHKGRGEHIEKQEGMGIYFLRANLNVKVK